MEPLPQAPVQGRTKFRWDAEGQQLELQDTYQLLIWAAQGGSPEEPLNPDMTTTLTEWEVNLDELRLVPGEEYAWSVVIVTLDTLEPRSRQATPRTFIYEGPVDGSSRAVVSVPS